MEFIKCFLCTSIRNLMLFIKILREAKERLQTIEWIFPGWEYKGGIH